VPAFLFVSAFAAIQPLSIGFAVGSMVYIGLGRMIASHHRSSALYHIH
jgi:hypothetical protein